MADKWVEINDGVGGRVLIWDSEPVKVNGNRYYGPFPEKDLEDIAEEVLQLVVESPAGFLSEIEKVINRWNRENS